MLNVVIEAAKTALVCLQQFSKQQEDRSGEDNL